jgi:flagellar biosynthetic protein FlhB
MAEDSSEKTQDASAYKLQEARKKGQIAKSIEFTAFCGLLLALVVLYIKGVAMFESLCDMVTFSLKSSSESGEALYLVVLTMSKAAKPVSIALMIVLIGALASVISGFIHAGPALSMFPLKPDFSKLNPVKGLKKIFSRKGFLDLTKAILKVVLFSWILYWLCLNFSYALHTNYANLESLFSETSYIAIISITFLLLAMGLFALSDIFISRSEFLRMMRMSAKEVKDEYKKQEGSPELKTKRKKNYKELFSKIKGISQLADADVVITNPTHVAVALKYRANRMPLPRVVVKGRGVIARIIRLRARMMGLPVLRRKQLARQLEAEVSIGSYIDVVMSDQVAEVYRVVLETSNHKVYS